MPMSFQRFNIYEWVISKPVESIRVQLEKEKCEHINAPNEVGFGSEQGKGEKASWWNTFS